MSDVLEGSWVHALDAAALEDGGMKGCQIGDAHIVIYKMDGELYATDNICTHAFALLSDGWLEGNIIECPLHGGQFDICTGKGLSDPIEKNLKTYKVRRIDGKIQIMI